MAGLTPAPGNVTKPLDKFVNVIDAVINQQRTTAPSLSTKSDEKEEGEDGDDDEDDNDDDDDKGKKPMQTTPPSPPAPTTARVPSAPSPPPGVTKAQPPPGITKAQPLIVAASPSPAPSTGSTGSSQHGSVANEVNTKIAAKGGGSGSQGAVAIISAVVVFCLAVVAIAVFVVRRRQNKATAHAKSLATTEAGAHSSRYAANVTVLDDTTANFTHMPNTADLAIGSTRPKQLQTASSTLADDAEITAVRIPMEKLAFGQLLSRGGFGEVYRGTYKGQPVAIKRLLPERRKDLRQIDAFLAEAKMMGTLDHERIVQFIGVAWDSLAEVCVVSEFMEGGDLRSVLTRWETTERRMHGFDHDKIKIALHVAHAMTYLHSMQPVILHRDLKSKNILLTPDYDAKLTDFGVSRERIDSTMTAGVGSSLWMAPEVMMGERYDEKADVFSFGVVLSELDTHLHPYSHATEPGTGRKIPDTAILQMVTLGRLTVEFTASADHDIVSLGRDCVALDPKDRPKAGEVLHRVHQAWRSCVTL